MNELFVPGVPLEFPERRRLLQLAQFLPQGRPVLKFWERHGVARSAHAKRSGAPSNGFSSARATPTAWRAIYPPMMYVIMALDLLGYPKDHPDVEEAEQQFFNLLVDDERGFYFQPCFSVVWDTGDRGLRAGRIRLARRIMSLTRAADWLLTKEVRRKGDWSDQAAERRAFGLVFRIRQRILSGYRRHRAGSAGAGASRRLPTRAAGAACKRAVELAARHAIERRRLGGVRRRQQLAFSERGAVRRSQRDARSDVSGYHRPRAGRADRVGRRSAIIRRSGAASIILKRTQEADGSWYGRWGVDYIYGTFLALRGLQAAGESDREAYILRAGEWLRSIQNADGGWGESCASYDQQHLTSPAPSTPSQTAWAILGLLAGGDTTSSSLHKGVEYLIETQQQRRRLG